MTLITRLSALSIIALLVLGFASMASAQRRQTGSYSRTPEPADTPSDETDEQDAYLDETHFQIGPRIGGIVAPTLSAHPLAEVVRASVDIGVRFSRYFDLRLQPSFFYETSDYEEANFYGATVQTLFWVAPSVYALGLGLGGGLEDGHARAGMSSGLAGQSGWFAAYATPLALQFGGEHVRFEISLNIGMVDFTAHGSVRPFGTLDIALLFWP